MPRKKIVRIPRTATIKCPGCGKKSRMKIPQNQQDSVQFFECKKCKQRINTPVMRCCIICAFSNKRCASSLIMEARAKGLEIRYK